MGNLTTLVAGLMVCPRYALPREIECCKCKWKDIQLFSGSFRREIQLDGNINKDKQKVRCQEVGQGRDKDVKWRAEVASLQTFSKKSLIFFEKEKQDAEIHQSGASWRS